ncbi:SH3 domain-containing protein [Sinorhizobium meliloti]|uniref:SH3 domain-containing protein n=1 Tax=Rhizobium meliloti TaxID=382 RepID=UPI0012973ACB|nr:SH3 domain-containing protein [Sinorhizobium meliloti]MQX92106.1 SH3 domain-containing protein [Sinorhizobium meliloti]
MKSTLLKIVTTGLLLLAPAIAQAAEGFATANVNMRAGPSTAYPAVTVIPAGESIEIYGCLADVPWCDVEFYDGRGWVHGRYIQALYQQRRISVGPRYYRPLGIPVVVFSFGSYWDRHYRDRDFYRDRDRWRRGPDVYRSPDRRAEPYRPPGRRPGFAPRPAPRPEFDRRLERSPDFSRTPERRRDFDDRPDRLPGLDRAPSRRPNVDTQPDSDRELRNRGDRNRQNFERRGDNGDRVIRRGDDNRNRGGDSDRRRPQRPVCQPGEPGCPN